MPARPSTLMSRSLRRGLATLAAAGLALTLTPQLAPAEPGAATRRDHQARCARTLPTGTSTLQVRFGGQSYPVRVHVPAGVPARRALPLVLDLHGSSSNGVVQAGISDFSALADREGFLVANPSGAIALPQPTPALPDGSFAWNVPDVPTTAGQFPPADARNDVAYLAAVVKAVDRAGCVDDRRVYAAGYSGGGRMASAPACARPDLVAAIAPISGLRAGRPSPVDTSVPEVQSCSPDRPVPVITFHGTADLVNPYPGSTDLRWGYAVSVALQTWARLDGCQVGPALTRVSEHVTRFSYRACRGDAEVVLYQVDGGGHTWPGTKVDLSPLGVTTQEIRATDLAWDFFAGHPRRG
ncbi:alpha/beta hydrolase family esterase [uncultured Friedmanniella sp.]|uniref:alpha/beta hydrolase family esterase n=1 Tax=uncultured Friedmanniella sp. TaxID=335381 RepID=UPI0035CA8283